MSEKLQAYALQVHAEFGRRGMSRSDFICRLDSKEIYFLEVHTLPGLSHSGNLATMASADGISYVAIVCHLFEWAMSDVSGR